MILSLSNLKPKLGSRHRPKRIGCGEGSGHGGSGSTRGMKGQRSRSGEGKNPGFEGGQMPLLRRIPKRGFSNDSFKKKYQDINLDIILKKFSDNESEITLDKLKDANILKSKNTRVKIISGKISSINKKIKIYAHKISNSAKQIIEKSGGEYVKLST